MFNIDSATAIPSMPTPDTAGTPGWFAQTSPYTATTADWANGIQAELLSILTEAGITPSKSVTDQVLSSIQKITYIKLFSPLNLYVSSFGSDTNPGTSIAPFATLQKAWDYISKSIIQNGQIITIHVSDGTYTSGVSCGFSQNTGLIQFIGNTTSPSSCVINVADGMCFDVKESTISVSGFQLQAGGVDNFPYHNAGIGLNVSNGGVINFNNINFYTCSNSHINCSNGGYISSVGSEYTINGNAPNHIKLNGTSMNIQDSVITISGTVTFSNSFVKCIKNANLGITGNSFVGTFIGIRYTASYNSIIDTGSSGSTYFPGNVAGTSDTGAFYI